MPKDSDQKKDQQPPVGEPQPGDESNKATPVTTEQLNEFMARLNLLLPQLPLSPDPGVTFAEWAERMVDSQNGREFLFDLELSYYTTRTRFELSQAGFNRAQLDAIDIVLANRGGAVMSQETRNQANLLEQMTALTEQMQKANQDFSRTVTRLLELRQGENSDMDLLTNLGRKALRQVLDGQLFISNRGDE